MSYALQGWKGWMIASIGYLEATFLLFLFVTGLPASSSGEPLVPSPLPSVSAGQAGNLEAGFQIEVPQGTGGLTPDLSIVYRGGPGGLLGNWDVEGLGMILLDETGKYQAIPGGPLLEASDGTYRTKMDGGNVYELSGGVWKVYTRDGLTLTYGSAGKTRLFDIDDTAYTWALDRVEDLKGNHYTVSYVKSGNRFYPETITYGKNTGLSGLKERSVVFGYTVDSSENVRIRYSHGMKQSYDRDINSISVNYDGTPIYSYSFTYTREGRSGLKRLSDCTRKFAETQYESTVSFGYSSHTPSYTKKTINKNPGVGTPDIGECKRMAETCQLAASDYTPPQIKVPAGYLCAAYIYDKVKDRCETGNTLGYGDFNGDGYQDLIGASDRYTGGGRIINEIKNGDLLSHVLDGNESAHTKGTAFYLDMNGDGRDDYVRLSSDHYVVSRATTNGGGNNYFSDEISYGIPANGRGMGYESEESLLEQLLELWIDYQLQQIEVKKARAMNNLSSAMSGIGFVTGGIMGLAAGNLLGTVVGQSLYGDMGKGLASQLQLGQQVMGQSNGEKDAFAQFADMNGDGLQDFVRLLAAGSSTGIISTAFNTSSGFGTDVKTTGINTGIPVTKSVKATAELNLDGLEDLNEDGVVDVNDLDELSDEEKAQYMETGEATVTSSKGFRTLADINGDGIPDFIALVSDGGGFRMAMHTGKSNGSFNAPVLSTLIDPGSDKFRFMTDINGDGYSDFLRYSSSGNDILITYGTGQGFGYTEASDVGASLETGRSLGDVNGDGTPDFLRLAKDGNGKWHAKARIFKGTGFHGSDVDMGFYHSDGGSANTRLVFFTDLNGDGLSDVLSPENGQSVIDTYVSATGSSFSLSSVSNEYTEISVNYRSGLEAADPSLNLRSGGSGGYSLLANTSPRLVVESVVVQDRHGTNKAKSTYEYSGDRIKIGPTREETRSLGPNRMVEKQYYWSNSWVQGPAYTETSYYHGESAQGYKTAGLEKRTATYRTSDGSLLSESEPSYTLRSSNPAMKNGESVYLVLANKRTKEERSTNQTVTSGEETLSYNPIGQPVCSVNRGDTSVSGDDRTTVVTYTGVSSSAYASLPASITVRAGSSCFSGTVVSYTELSYDGNGNVLTKKEGPDSSHTRTVSFTYDSAGNVLSETRYGLTTQTEYDTETAVLPIKLTSPQGFVTERSYETARGLPVSETDPNGTTVTHTYDGLGRKIRSNLNPGTLTSGLVLSSASYSYDADGGLTTVNTSATPGNTTRTVTVKTDVWGREISRSVSSPEGLIVTGKEYDAQDRVVSESLPHLSGGTAASNTYIYDDLGRVTSLTRPHPTGSGSVTITQEPDTLYTAKFTSSAGVELKGYAQKDTTPGGQDVYIYKTLDGRKIQEIYTTSYLAEDEVVTEGFARIRHHYDSRGRLKQVTRTQDTTLEALTDDPDMTVKYEYDDYGRMTKGNDPDRGETKTGYTDFDMPECVEREGKDVICKTYDEYHRVSQIRKDNAIDGYALVRYEYDDTGTFGKKGGLRTIKDATGRRDFSYSPLTGGVTKTERKYKFGDYRHDFDIRNTYDETGALTERKFSATNISLKYDYDTAGRLAGVNLKDPDGHLLAGGSQAEIYRIEGRDAFEKPKQIVYGNGVKTVNAYNVSGYRTSMKVYTGEEGNILSSDFSFNWNADGMLVKKIDNLATEEKNYTEEFTYDTAHRLVGATGPYDRSKEATRDRQTSLFYAYGSDGQPLVFAGNDVEYDADPSHRMKEAGSVMYDYDLEGRGEDPEIADDAVEEEDGAAPEYDTSESEGETAAQRLATDTLVTRDERHGHHHGHHHNWGNPCDGYHNHHGHYFHWGKHRRGCYREPAEEGVGNVIYRFNTAKYTNYYYNWQDRISRAVTRKHGHVYEGLFTYDDAGNRFRKKSDLDGYLSETVILSPDYRIFTDHHYRRDIHVVEVRTGNTLVARLQFRKKFHYSHEGSSALYLDRAIDSIGHALSLTGGMNSLPIHLGSAMVATKQFLHAAAPPEIPWEGLAQTIIILLAILSAFVLLREWERERVASGYERKHGQFSTMQRLTALLALTAWMPLATGCWNGLAGSDKGKFKDKDVIAGVLGWWTYGGGSGGSSNPASPGNVSTGGSPVNYKTGTDFYIAVTNGSTDLITDESGTLIARYAYEPFGRINPYASDTDVDGDHKRYSGGFWYTGQEYELETDVYDFHARTYDAQTGRFMQPDPVFTAMPGRDSYDSYQYAGNDPVNFMDPDGRKMCSGNTVAALALTAGAVGMVGAAAFGVVGNWTGGGGDCSNRMPDEGNALYYVLEPFLAGSDPVKRYMVSHYYENYMKGHGPSFLGKMNKTELQFTMLHYHQYLQNDGKVENDSYAVLAYFMMAQDVANPRFDIDEASYYHDQFGPDVLDPRNRTATSRWIKHANRVAFSHDSWSRTYAREKKATPKWWGDARGGVATINTAATVVGNMAMAVTGTVLFSVANALTGTKNLGNPRKWRL